MNLYVLSEKQVDFILNDIRRNGIHTEELQLNLLDHICCVIENEMSPEKSFDEFYRSVLSRFFKKELKEIQEETDLLLTFKNYYTMKKVMLRSGMFSAAVFTIGAIFKIMHYPGASVMLVLAIVSVSFVFLPIFCLIKSKEVKEKKEKFIIGSGVIFGILFCLSTLFKIMHWPGAGLLWMVALCVLFFLFLPLYFFTGVRNPETKMNTILSSAMILIAGGLLFTLASLPKHDIERDSSSKIAFGHLKETIFNISKNNDFKYKIAADSVKEENNILHNKVDLVVSKIMKLREELNLFVFEGEKIEEEDVLMIQVSSLSPTMYLFNDKNEAIPNLLEIKTSIIELKKYIDLSYGKNMSELLNTSNRMKCDGEKDVNVIWEHAYFYHVPLDNIYRNFDQLILDIRITESSCIQ